MKAVDLMVNSILPPDLRRPDHKYSKKGLDDLLAQVAFKHPEKYAQVLGALSDVGRNAAYVQGETLKLDDLRPIVDRDSALAQMDQEIAVAAKHAKSPDDLANAKLRIWSRAAEDLEKSTSAAALAGENALGHSVMSGARGNAGQLKSMITTPGLYTDYKDRIIPLFVRHSFSEGLRPAEYLASSYGTRRSVIQTKAATAQFGDILKQWNAAGATVSVTTHDCGTSNGLDMDTDDPDVSGRVVAKTYGDVKAGDVLDRRTISELHKKGVKKVIVRSPMTCQAKTGICSHCLGHLPDGHFAKIGYAAGITAASAVGEPLVQGSLQCLAEGTMVVMGDGHHQTIETINPGDWVLGSGKDGKTRPVLVLNKWEQGLQPCYRMHYRVHRTDEVITLRATAKHRLLCQLQSNTDWSNQMSEARYAKRVVLADKPKLYGTRFLIEAIGSIHCWDLEVESEEHLFVLDNGLVVQNSKHSGGAFKGTKKQFTGYGVINQIIQSPETFPHRAAVSEKNGRVEAIEDAPQGGKFITVEGHKHYALPGYEPTVKPGDTVEAGDQMSEGIMDVADIVRLRGIGEGRRYYVDRLKQALEESGGGKIGKMNLEVLARASLDHARIESPDGMGDLLPDDIASYNRLSSDYSPPKDTKMLPVEHAHGKYLQSPVLHFSIGTKLTPKMTSRIKDSGVSHVPVSDSEPPFVPEMVRLRAVTHNNPDWFARMHGSYLGTGLQDSAIRSRDTDTESNTHFAPRLAIGKDFGKTLERTGKF